MKKIYSILVVFSLLLTFLPSNPAAGADIIEKADSYSMILAKSFGFMEQGVRMNDTLTKADLAKIIAFFSGYQEPNVTDLLKYRYRLGVVTQYDYKRIEGQPIFKDVPSGYWAAGYIEHCALNGTMRGSADDKYTFLPNDAVKLEDVYYAMLKLLGYDRLEQYIGGMHAAAIHVGINVKNSESDTLTYGILADVLFRTFNTPVFRINEIDKNGSTTYTRGNPFMEEMYDIYLLQNAQITATDLTNIISDSYTNKGSIRINDEPFVNHVDNIYSFLGYKGDAYYLQDSDSSNKELKFFMPLNYSETYVSSDDVLSIDKQQAVISVSSGRNSRNIKLAPSLTVIYNNQLLTMITDDDLEITDGDYLFADTTNSGSIDLLFIREYEYMIVGGVVSSSEYILGEHHYISPQGLDKFSYAEDDDGIQQSVTFFKGETKVSPDVIRSGDVLSILRGNNLNPRAVMVYISSNSANIQVDGLTVDKGIVHNGVSKPDLVDSGGIEYRLSGLFYESGSSIEAGDSGFAFFTKTNKILAFNKQTSGDVKYGYLRGINSPKGLFDSSYSFKILNTDNEWIVYKTGKTINVNNVFGKPDKIIPAAAPLWTTPGNVKPQMIRYRANISSIISIETVQRDLSKTINFEEKEQLLRSAIANGEFFIGHNEQLKSLGSLRTLSWKINAQQPVPCFVVPSDENLNTAIDDDFAATSFANAFPYDVLKTCVSYDVDLFGNPKVLLTYGSAGGSTGDEGLIITTVTEALNEDGTKIKKIYGQQNQSEVSYELSDRFNESSFEVIPKNLPNYPLEDLLVSGAIVKIGVNMKNQIEFIRFLYSPVMGEHLLHADAPGLGSAPNVFCRVQDFDVNGRMIRAKVNFGGNLIILSLGIRTSTPFVVIYNGESEKAAIGSVADISKGDYLVMRGKDGQMHDFFIFRNMPFDE